MELLTKDLETKLRANYARGRGTDADPEVVCKLFNPAGHGVWLLCEMLDDGDTLMAVADLGMGCVEYGSISLKALRDTRVMNGLLPLERDRYFTPKRRFADYLAMPSLDGIGE